MKMQDDSDGSSMGDISYSGSDDPSMDSKSQEVSGSSSDDILAGKETQDVRRFRAVLYLVLFGLMVLTSVGLFFYIQNDQEGKFQVEFVSKGTKIISGFNDDSFRILQSLETLSTSLTGRALDSNSSWPYVTIQNSAQILEPYLVANVASLVVLPIVGVRERTTWEKYVRKEQGWVETDLKQRSYLQAQEEALEEDDPENRQLQYFAANDEDAEQDTSVSPFIKNYVGVDVSKGPWVVWWQYAPVIANKWFLNFNRLAFEGFQEEVPAVLRGEAVISKLWTYEPGLDFQSTRDFTFLQELLTAGGNGRYQPGEPIGFIHYPVKDQFGPEAKTAAVLTATIYWRTYFQNVLPQDTKGIICVVKNSQGQAFSYLIQGQDSVFLGSGDLHDSKYDSLGMSADYSKFSSADALQKTDYTGVPVDDAYISYTIHVYPTSDMESDYISNAPAIWLTCALACFIVIIAVFVVYDRRVETRQHVVWSSAVKSNNVVSDIFPAHMRDRLMDQETKKLERASTSSSKRGSLRTFLNDAQDNPEAAIGGNLGTLFNSTTKPMADLFLDVTVCHADIVGFTAWSSVREPFHVFSLLETLYSAFDKVARKRRVYKVETVGDCYCAVAGLVYPRKDHAVAIARFSRDILSKMHHLTKELEVSLGPDTAGLALRVGIHSGPVTAGVLRGERARFQLFGDIVFPGSGRPTIIMSLLQARKIQNFHGGFHVE